MASYQPRPFVRERYEQNSRLADLMMQQGRNAANAQRQQGDISAQMWGNVGNTISNAIGQYAQGRQQQEELKQRAAADAPRREMEALKLSEAKEQKASRSAAQDAIAQIKSGNAEAVLSTLQPEARAIAEDWLGKTAANKKQRETLQIQDAQESALFVRRMGYDPAVAEVVFGVKADDYPELKSIWSQVKDNPEKLKQVIDHFADYGKEPAAAKVSAVNPEFDVIDEKGTLVRKGTPKPEKPASEPNPTEASLAMLAAKGDPAAAKALALMRQQRPPDKEPRPDYEWVTRDGKPVQIQKGTARPGDAPFTPPRSTSETAQDRQRTARTEAAQGFLTRLNELREKINTKMGPAAGVTGTVRRGVAAVGWDPDVAEYERIRAAGGRSLAVAIMGAQNLSDADADAWSNMLPGATVDKETAKRLTDQVARMLATMDEPKQTARQPTATAPAPAAPAKLGANTTQIVEQGGVRFKVTTDASGKVISSEAVR